VLRRIAPCLLLVTLCGHAFADSSSSQASSGPDQLQRVEVNGSSNAGDRRDAPAAKMILSREDVLRFGDTALADVLRRVPGISVSGTQGRSTEIRMRGLGNGYTQFLIDGEPVAQGFSIDSISPELIDRIEINRSATADMSTQSIAGTINIILKRTSRVRERELKLGVSGYDGLPSETVTTQYSDREGAVSYSLAGNLSHDRNRWPSNAELRAYDGNGQPLYGRATQSREQGTQLVLGLTPRLTWKRAEDQSLSVEGLLQVQPLRYTGREDRTTLFGSDPTFARNEMSAHTDSTQAKLSVGWKTGVGHDGRLDAKTILSLNRRHAESSIDGFDEDETKVLSRTVSSVLRDNAATATVKYAVPILEDHSLEVGWDQKFIHRAETRVQREQSSTGFPTTDLDEDYAATVTRQAVFCQDEWAATPRLSVYGGLRWEGLSTRTAGNALSPVQHRSGVFSPIAQLLWKIPDTKSDQLRLSLGRTYKAPTAKELIPRRWVVNDNSATSPNFQGNPELVPELAWGLDLGYEHYLSHGGFVGVNGYARRIANVILPRVYEDNGTWISTPTNSGNAQVLGIELEAKGKLRLLADTLPDIDVRSGLSRNWSKVQSVPGPDNRLSSQPALIASVGGDYHLVGETLVLGGNFSYERNGFVRTSAVQATDTSNKQTLDLYGLWIIDKTARLRLSFNNVLRRASVVRSSYVDTDLDQVLIVNTPSFSIVRLQLDLKL